MRNAIKTYAPAVVVCCILFWIVWSTAFPPVAQDELLGESPLQDSTLSAAVQKVDAWFAADWEARQLPAAEKADDLTILRRMSLALHGTIPSIEELRQFEADTRPDRLAIWCGMMLEDPRFANYVSERLTRAFVGTQGEPFLVFRRDRFRNWIAEQLQANRPYDEVVREIISSTGLWTGEPATNFVTHAVQDGNVDANKLAGKTVRAVLGQRIDCAQCHDHPFAEWKQNQFEGLAAYFGKCRLTAFGIDDPAGRKYEVEDRQTLEKRVVEPNVPFDAQWLPDTGSQRSQLAVWCTHPENLRFARATANRVWAIMFGKAYSEAEPYYTRVDDLPDPDPDAQTALDLLAEQFIASGFNLRQLFQTIAASRPFQMASVSTAEDDILKKQVEAWAVFPLVRLRPEQIVGSMLQASSIKTIDQRSHLLTRTLKLINENDFMKEYGDLGADEFESRASTIPQALLRMNGKLADETIKPNPFNATPRIAMTARNREMVIDTAYLACLSRYPTDDEHHFFLNQWAEGGKKGTPQKTHDLYWVLFNSPEFSWNH
ncbi:MAG: DUF1549 domain-containing protein [Planctomycetaceae bacterium]|nr:DUF1549 domain-containing protein [Planctomycetaceae bacterium]